MNNKKLSNFIFVLIAGFVMTGNKINPNSNFNNVWDFEPGIKLFYHLFKKTQFPIKKRAYNKDEKFKPEWA